MREAGYEVAVTAADAPRLADVGYDVFLEDGHVVEVGQVRLHGIDTPGHTEGSICFRVEGSPILFSGDTLFPGGPGNRVPRRRLFHDVRSMETKLFTLPDELRVLPGHGDDTTIGKEKPHLQEWIDRGW